MEKYYVVFLESDVYGSEQFEYDTLQEALDGLERLEASTAIYQAKDHIERTLTLRPAYREEAL